MQTFIVTYEKASDTELKHYYIYCDAEDRVQAEDYVQYALPYVRYAYVSDCGKTPSSDQPHLVAPEWWKVEKLYKVKMVTPATYYGEEDDDEQYELLSSTDIAPVDSHEDALYVRIHGCLPPSILGQLAELLYGDCIKHQHISDELYRDARTDEDSEDAMICIDIVDKNDESKQYSQFNCWRSGIARHAIWRITDLYDEAIDAVIRQKFIGYWDLDLCGCICCAADMEKEWEEAEGDDFEDVVLAAAEKLGVDIYSR